MNIKCLFFIFLLGILPIQAICEQSLENQLADSVVRCDFDNVKSLIAKGADINAQNTYWSDISDSILMLTSGFEFGERRVLICAEEEAHIRLDIAKFLIEKGADINAKNKYNQTALIWAAYKGDIDMIELLIEKGANIGDKDIYGIDALLEATRQGRLEAVKTLIKHKADINAREAVGRGMAQGRTALMIASQHGYAEIVQYLIENGADINAMNHDGKTALNWAYNDKIVEILEQAGAKWGTWGTLVK